jgi:type I restriction-modification system DNA methylase subunit
LNIANRYLQEVNLNNTKIKEILDNNYSQIDPDDIDIFMLFVEHFLRYKKEIEDQGKLTTPISIYERIGDISFLRPEFIERVKLKFKQKKSALDNLYL